MQIRWWSGDSHECLELDLSSARVVLTSHRVWGDPVFLRAVSRLAGGLDRLPLLQTGLQAAAVLGLWMALVVFGFSGWAALGATAPLLFLHVMRESRVTVLSEGLALPLVLAALSSLRRNARGLTPADIARRLDRPDLAGALAGR